MDYNFIGHQENFNEDVSSLLKILSNQTEHKNEKYGPENNYQDTSTKDWYENIPCEVMRLDFKFVLSHLSLTSSWLFKNL